MLRKILAVIVLFLLLAGGALWWFTRPLPILTVTSWAGTYGQAQQRAMMRPYAAANRVDVRIGLWDGELDDLVKAVGSHAYSGDVIDLELPRAVEACRRGLLEKIDTHVLPAGANGTAAGMDFVPGALGACWVGSVVYSQVIVARPHTGATTQADFFDTAKFPGSRALSRVSPKFALEMALLADGVAPGEIYKTLDTPAGLDRAFAKLEALHPVWANDSADALEWVRNGRAAFAATLNGTVFDALQHGFTPDVIWDRQLYEMDVFGIPAGDPKKDMALDFIRYATGSAPLAGVAGWTALGPARRSSLALVTDNPELKIATRPLLPTAHFATAFAVDDGWWLINEAKLSARWQALVMK